MKTLVNCFNNMKENRDVRKKTRRLLNRYFGPMENEMVRFGFRVWKDNVKSLSFAQQDELLQAKNDLIASLSAKLELLEDKTQNLALSKAKSMIQMWRNKCLINVFKSWCVFAKESVEGKCKMTRFIAKWKNAGVCKCLLAWRGFCVEEKKNKVILSRFLRRMQVSERRANKRATSAPANEQPSEA